MKTSVVFLLYLNQLFNDYIRFCSKWKYLQLFYASQHEKLQSESHSVQKKKKRNVQNTHAPNLLLNEVAAIPSNSASATPIPVWRIVVPTRPETCGSGGISKELFRNRVYGPVHPPPQVYSFKIKRKKETWKTFGTKLCHSKKYPCGSFAKCNVNVKGNKRW